MNHSLIDSIRSVPDFPKKGIMFRDITTLLKDPAAFRAASDQFCGKYAGMAVDKVVAIESRGFMFGSLLAYSLNAGFVPVRKPGKLPAATLRQSYSLEYGTDSLEIHRDGISPGERVLIHDDLLATGGTMEAACKLVEQLGGKIIGLSFIIELTFLNGRKRLGSKEVFSLVSYDNEE